MNRRSFFGVVLGAFAAVVVPWRRRTPTVAGINQATFTFWRNRGVPPDPTAYDALRTQMRNTYNQCSAGEEMPNVVYFLSEDGPMRLSNDEVLNLNALMMEDA